MRTTMLRTRGEVGRVHTENEVPVGYSATCPFCGETNIARYDEVGTLIWWPNTDVGTWCRHASGAYQGAGVNPQFLFR